MLLGKSRPRGFPFYDGIWIFNDEAQGLMLDLFISLLLAQKKGEDRTNKLSVTCESVASKVWEFLP
jgi:hypothetical protein